MNMKRNLMFWLAATLLVACGQKSQEERMASPSSEGKTSEELLLEGDSTIYGLACEGSGDSVVVLLPTDGRDPVSYNVIEAHRQQKVHGSLSVGDWIGLVRNAEDSTVADLVVDLDELKGTWCYVVMPRLIREVPDSVKQEYFIPREYGFSLKRQWTAQSVGYVRPESALESKSPVEYPQLRFFTEWHILNGKLVMTSGDFRRKADSDEMEMVSTRNDTCDILYLRGDSLVLGSEGATRSYYRHTNKDDINKIARQKAEERLRRAMKN